MNEDSSSQVFPEIEHLLYAIELRDSYTQGHSVRVADFSYLLSSLWGLSLEDCNQIYIAALLHDIGKIGIPDTILLKPSQLEEDEYKLVQQHGFLSGKILEKMPKYTFLAPLVRHHHEDYNGTGYPDGLKGDMIPLGSRIISIVDVFDALTSKRIYRGMIPFKKALQIMYSMQENIKFDPDIFKVFMNNIDMFSEFKHQLETTNGLEELDFLRNNFFFSDHLTKLLNRDALLAILKKCSFSDNVVLFSKLNIKEFRQYNQEYGTKRGDLLLQNIASYLKNNLKAIIHHKEPEQNNLFLFRPHGDVYCILYIGHKIGFIDHKINKVLEVIKIKLGVELSYSVLIEEEKVPENIEKQIGYLL